MDCKDAAEKKSSKVQLDCMADFGSYSPDIGRFWLRKKSKKGKDDKDKEKAVLASTFIVHTCT